MSEERLAEIKTLFPTQPHVTGIVNELIAEVRACRADYSESVTRYVSMLAEAEAQRDEAVEALRKMEAWMMLVSDGTLDGLGKREQYVADFEMTRAVLAKMEKGK
tara:strand:- start:136 stop:450 length:315 start_codon:yes stop_codon:yes gene_type:complete